MSNNEYGEDKNGIQELSIDNFNLNTKKCVTNQGKSGLIIFYQYWCLHCRILVPEVVKMYTYVIVSCTGIYVWDVWN